MRLLAVGDIHTKIHIIDKVRNIIDDYDAIVFVGDYADDWSASAGDSIRTWERLKELQEAHSSKVTVMMGNHDFAYLKHVNERQSGFNDNTKMLMSLPENKELEAWLSGLPEIKEIDGVLYSHAGVTNFWASEFGVDSSHVIESPKSLWRNDSPLWARPDEFQFEYYGTKQVFGHTPSKTCHRITENIWCIDTFSTRPDGAPIGDGSVLEITNGEQFKTYILEDIN